MPDGDGLKLLGELRSNGNHIPCLVLTARDTVEDRVNGLDTGADDYLVKPFAMTELIARVWLFGAWVGRKRLFRSAGPNCHSARLRGS